MARYDVCPLNEYYGELFPRRISKPDDLLGLGFPVPWDAEVISINGAHYHFFIPPYFQGKAIQDRRKKFLRNCQQAARWQGDPVSYSYSYMKRRFFMEHVKKYTHEMLTELMSHIKEYPNDFTPEEVEFFEELLLVTSDGTEIKVVKNAKD